MGRHVFICGFSRSGTTMFYNMLRTTVTNFRFVDQEKPARLIVGSTPDDYVTKQPLDIFDIDRILAANTLAKELTCIIMVRDIRGLLTSRHVAVPDDYFIGVEHQYRVSHDGISNTNPGIAPIHNAIAITLKRKVLKPVFVRYEDLLRDPEGMQAELGRIVGFEYNGAFRDFHRYEPPPKLRRTMGTLRPPDPTRIDAWRAPEHRERIIGQFSRYPKLFRLLQIYGYEQDDSWFDAYLREALAPAS